MLSNLRNERIIISILLNTLWLCRRSPLEASFFQHKFKLAGNKQALTIQIKDFRNGFFFYSSSFTNPEIKQVVAKMKSKHIGGTFTKKKKCTPTTTS